MKMKFSDYLAWATDEEGELLVQQISIVGDVHLSAIYSASLGGRKCEPIPGDVFACLLESEVMPESNTMYKDFSRMLGARVD